MLRSGHGKAELQEFTMDLRRSPIQIPLRQGPDQRSHLFAVLRPALRDRQGQYHQKPARCQPTTVSGFTMTRTSAQWGQGCRSVVQKSRSTKAQRGPGGVSASGLRAVAEAPGFREQCRGGGISPRNHQYRIKSISAVHRSFRQESDSVPATSPCGPRRPESPAAQRSCACARPRHLIGTAMPRQSLFGPCSRRA
jgi:hypothetical protein